MFKTIAKEILRFSVFILILVSVTAIAANQKGGGGGFANGAILTSGHLNDMQIEWTNILNRPNIPANQNLSQLIKQPIDNLKSFNPACHGDFGTANASAVWDLMSCMSACNTKCKTLGFFGGTLSELLSGAPNTASGTECTCSM